MQTTPGLQKRKTIINNKQNKTKGVHIKILTKSKMGDFTLKNRQAMSKQQENTTIRQRQRETRTTVGKIKGQQNRRENRNRMKKPMERRPSE